MIRPLCTLAILAAAGATGGCVDLVDVEARASEVCLTGLHVDIPGGAPDRVEASHVLEEPATELPAQVEASAELTGVSVSAVGEVEDLGFLRSARVAIDADGLPALSVADIGEDESAVFDGAQSWFFAAEGEDLELIDYLLAPELGFDLAFEGDMPDSDWAVEIDLCAQGKARYAEGL